MVNFLGTKQWIYPARSELFVAFRIVTKTGMQTLIQQAMKNGGGAVESTGAEIPFDPTSYRSVHFLAANTEKRPFEDLLKKTVQGWRRQCSVGPGYLGGKFKLKNLAQDSWSTPYGTLDLCK